MVICDCNATGGCVKCRSLFISFPSQSKEEHGVAYISCRLRNGRDIETGVLFNIKAEKIETNKVNK